MKRSTKRRYHNDWIDFRDDGRYGKDRIKGRSKRSLTKWGIKQFVKDLDKE